MDCSLHIMNLSDIETIADHFWRKYDSDWPAHLQSDQSFSLVLTSKQKPHADSEGCSCRKSEVMRFFLG